MAETLKGKLKRGLRVIKTLDIKIEDLIIENRFRDPTDEDVEMLGESLEEHGQPRAITVRKDPDKPEKYRVIAGATLVKAAESRGWPSVRADVLKCTDAEARRWEVDENLFRHRHTAIEEAEHIAERMRTFDNEEAESRQKGGKPKQGRPLGAIAKAAGKLRLKGKTQKARRKQIERGLKIASITPEAKAAANETGLHDNRSALLEIADEDTTEEQLAKVQELARGKSSSNVKRRRNPWLRTKTKKTKQSASKASLSSKDKKALAKLNKTWDETELKPEFDKASQAVRDGFIEHILRSASGEKDDTETELEPKQQDDNNDDENDNDKNNDDENDNDNDNNNDNNNEQSNDDWV
jgi:ParB/RepB/Spo0J family partition protein